MSNVGVVKRYDVSESSAHRSNPKSDDMIQVGIGMRPTVLANSAYF